MQGWLSRAIYWLAQHFLRWTVIVPAVVVIVFLYLYSWYQDGRLYVVFVADKPLDAASLMLVAATLVVTGVGVLAAILAVWGYREIRESSERAAEKAAREIAARVAKEIAEPVAARTAQEAVDASRDATSKDIAGKLLDELKKQ